MVFCWMDFVECLAWYCLDGYLPVGSFALDSFLLDVECSCFLATCFYAIWVLKEKEVDWVLMVFMYLKKTCWVMIQWTSLLQKRYSHVFIVPLFSKSKFVELCKKANSFFPETGRTPLRQEIENGVVETEKICRRYLE